ncbi:MAG TPA: histidine phosphatase family protein [Polyangia bacterium]
MYGRIVEDWLHVLALPIIIPHPSRHPMPHAMPNAMPHVLELWLVRHGESTFNAEGRFAGWSDPPLTPAGETMARELFPRLAGIQFDGIWCSDRIRAKETARLAGFEQVPTDVRLREIHFGDLEGRTFLEMGEEWRARLRSFADFSAPGGESTPDVQRRAEDFLAGLAIGRHLIFSHGGWIRTLMAACGDDRFPDKAELVKLDWSNRRIIP